MGNLQSTRRQMWSSTRGRGGDQQTAQGGGQPISPAIAAIPKIPTLACALVTRMHLRRQTVVRATGVYAACAIACLRREEANHDCTEQVVVAPSSNNKTIHVCNK